MPICRFTCPTLSIISSPAAGAEGEGDASPLVLAILLPNANKALPGGTHPDGSPAVRHYGGIAVVDTEASVITFQTDLFHHEVQIDDGNDTDCVAAPSLSAIPDLRAMVNDGAAQDIRVREGEELDDRVAATITFRGGSLGTWDESVTAVEYSYPTARGQDLPSAPMASYLEWTPESAMRIRVREVGGKGWTEITLSGNETVIIYNWDVRHPTLRDFEPVPPPSLAAGQVIVDTDFKWLYQLLMPPDDNWDAWLASVESDGLPAPELRCDTGTAGRMKSIVEQFQASLSERPTLRGYLLSPKTGQPCGCSRWVHR